MIFYRKKFLLACGTKASLAVLGCETCANYFLNILSHQIIRLGQTRAKALQTVIRLERDTRRHSAVLEPSIFERTA
jgi:hypothetical protein